MDSRYKHKIGQEVANSAPTPVTPTDDSKEVVNVEYLHGKLADAGGGSGTVISNITSVTANYLLTTTSNNAILRVKDYASVIVPSGLGLKHRTVIKKATGKTVSLTAGENVVLETPSGSLPEVLAQNDAIEIVCEEITNGVEYWGVYGALATGSYGMTNFFNVKETSVETKAVIFPIIHKSSDWRDVLTFTKDYFMLYSSDHSSGAGGLYWGEMDDPEGTGFIERGLILSGSQAETPFLTRMPTGNPVGIFYHIEQSSGTVQQTVLMDTPGGAELHNCTYTDQGFPLGLLTDESHTGYLKILGQNSTGDYVGHHLVNGNGGMGVSTSPDLRTWTRVIGEVDRNLTTTPVDSFFPVRASINPFDISGVTYGLVGCRETVSTDKFIAIFELDDNYLPTNYLRTALTGFEAYDGQWYKSGGIGYLFVFTGYEDDGLHIKDDVLYQFKFQLQL